MNFSFPAICMIPSDIPSNTNGNIAFNVIIAAEGSEFCTIALTFSFESINLPSHGIVFFISL